MLEDVLIREDVYKSDHVEDSPREAMHIAFGIDRNFARPMGVAMTSIILHHIGEKLSFHVFTDGLNDEDLRRIEELTKKYEVIIKIYYINTEVFKNLRSTAQWTIATYFRFITASVLCKTIDKVLYLDADIICLGSLKELFALQLKNATVAAVNDLIDPYNFKIRMEKINITCGQYFNAGMLYINLKQWNEKNISERAIKSLIKDLPRYDYFDQDILNVLLENDVQYIDKTYNYLYNMEVLSHGIPADVRLLHYATREKPWHVWCVHPIAKHFREYSKRSPWNDVKWIDQPRNYKEMRMMGKACIKMRKYPAALVWYFKYILNKFGK